MDSLSRKGMLIVFSVILVVVVSLFYNYSNKKTQEIMNIVSVLRDENKDLKAKLEEKKDKIKRLNNKNEELLMEIESMKSKQEKEQSQPSYQPIDQDGFFIAEFTAYEVGGTCANGMPALPGVVAVDPDVIPLNSTIYIEVDGRPEFNGTYIAADTGGAVVGNIIDICMESGHWEFGRRSGRAKIVQ